MIFTEPKLAERLNDIFPQNTDLVKGNQLDNPFTKPRICGLLKRNIFLLIIRLAHSLLNRNKTGH